MEKKDNPHSGHRDRMWDKFSDFGIVVFNEHEILELLLFLVLPRVNTNPIAHKLLDEFGSLRDVLLAAPEELQRVEGIGEKAALHLSFIGKLRNYTNQTQSAAQLSFDSLEIVTKYCTNHFKDQTSEKLVVLLLDDKYSLLHVHDITNNKPNHVTVNYRELFAQIMKYDCRKVVIAHNHVVGTAEPSDDDLKLTRELVDALNKIGVGCVDHIIVYNGTAVSMRGSGFLNDIWENC